VARTALALALLAGCSDPPEPPKTPVARAIGFLVSRQAGGLWKSDPHPTLGSGQALTPFVLYALSHARPDELAPHRRAIDAALDRLPLPGNEYPTYSLALAILALKRLRPGRDVSDLERELRAKQLVEPLGWTPDDPEYGGWDEGVIPARKPQAQRPNVSVTAFAVEALGPDEKSRRFANRCRAESGLFFFTPSATWSHQNKAGPGAGYASTTFDAVRILAGELPPGALDARLLPEWEEAILFYRAFAEAKVRPSPELARRVAERQRPDGSFANASVLMKEDDPIVATGLALVALALARQERRESR
jgi:hypothetical protein